MNVTVFYTKSTGIAEVCVMVLGRVLDIDRIEVDSIIPDTVEHKRGIDPRNSVEVPFDFSDPDIQAAVTREAIEAHCRRAGDTVTEYNII